MIIYKSPDDQIHMRDLDIRLMRIVVYAERLAWSLGLEPITITSIRRYDGSTHDNKPPYRFLDFGMFRRINNDWFRNHLNQEFPYGGKPGIETVAPLRHGSGPHYHCQVKPI